MRIVKSLIIAMVTLVALFMVGCAGVSTADRNPVIEVDEGKDFACIDSDDLFKEGGAGSLTINNKASFDVVIFAGKISNNKVLGGIKAGKSRAFDLSKMGLIDKNGSFLIRAASYKTYTKSCLQMREDDVLYSGLVVYDLNDSNDRVNMDIFVGIQESKQEYIYATNHSPFVLELRLNHPAGDKIATLHPNQDNKKIYLTPLDDGMPYTIYPSYVYVDPKSNEIKSFLSKSEKDRYRERPENDGVSPLMFKGPESTSDIGYAVGFLRLKNSTPEGLNLRDGMTWLKDQKGSRFVRSGKATTFELSAESSQAYRGLNVEFDRAALMKIASLQVERGVIYDLEIYEENGNYEYNVQASGFKDKLEDMKMSLLFE
jgi:hypothetical protein